MAQRKSIEVGDRVALSAQFLRDICEWRHSRYSLRGTVVACEGELRQIKWDGYGPPDFGPEYVNQANLVRMRAPRRESEVGVLPHEEPHLPVYHQFDRRDPNPRSA